MHVSIDCMQEHLSKRINKTEILRYTEIPQIIKLHCTCTVKYRVLGRDFPLEILIQKVGGAHIP